MAIKKQYAGTKEEVQGEILSEMYKSMPDVYVAHKTNYPLTVAENQPGYELLSFVSVDPKGFGYLISAHDGISRGLYYDGTLNLQAAAYFARIAIPEIYSNASDDHQERIFKDFIKTSVKAVMQDIDSTNYLWGLFQTQ